MLKDFRCSNIGFFTVMGLYFAGFCVLYGYMVNILLWYGFTEIQCGTIATLQSVAFMAVQPVYGYIIDNFLSAKKLLIIVATIGAIMSAFLPVVLELEFAYVMIYMTVLSLFYSSSTPIMDTWAVSVSNNVQNVDYGLVRGGGSFFYAFMAFFAGGLIAPFGAQILFYIHIGFVILTLLLAFFLVDDKKVAMSKQEIEQPKEKMKFSQGMAVLFRNKQYIVLLFCMSFYQFSIRIAGTYLPMVIRDIGGDESHFGYAVFVCAFCELIVMVIASRLMLRGMPLAYLLMASFVSLSFRFLLFVFTDNVWVLIAMQTIMAIGVGLNLRVVIEYIYEIAPKGYTAIAILLFGAITNGFGAVLGSYLGGIIIDSFGVTAYILTCTTIMGLAVVTFFPTFIRAYKETRERKIFVMTQGE